MAARKKTAPYTNRNTQKMLDALDKPAAKKKKAPAKKVAPHLRGNKYKKMTPHKRK